MAEVDVEGLRLIDHHCHGVVKADLDLAGFENLIAESSDPPPRGTSRFDSPLGLAVRRWCAPVLGLEPFASPQ
ncbi:MAG: amidohydrolase, partial [Actinobacteria bacterium]